MKRVLAQFGSRQNVANDRVAAEAGVAEAGVAEELRTGVVRKVVVPAGLSPALPSQSGVGLCSESSETRGSRDAAREDMRAWRCLEWADRPSQRPAKPNSKNSKVSIVQLSMSGRLLRQTGPSQWLPEASDFVHRMALLVAQGLGFDHCRAVCLRNQSAVLSVTEAGPTKIVAVSGPPRQMPNVLRRMGLE
jgi:hypothetical protein